MKWVFLAWLFCGIIGVIKDIYEHGIDTCEILSYAAMTLLGPIVIWWAWDLRIKCVQLIKPKWDRK